MSLDTKQNETDISLDRAKRDAPTKEEICNSLELASVMRGRAATLVSGIADLASAIPFFGGLWQTAASGITTGILTAQSSADIALIEMDCGSIPFDDIKKFVKERFDNIDKDIDRNYAALQDISKTVSKTLAAVELTRFEMNNQFERFFSEHSAAEISHLNSFIQDFDIAKTKIDNYSKANYIANIDEIKLFLNYLNDSKLKKHSDALDTMINVMIDTKGNNVTLSQLFALYSGARTLVSMHLFRYEQYSYIADYYYEIGKLDDFNQQFQKLREFKLNFGKIFDIMKKINDISETIKEKYFIVDDAELINVLNKQIDDLNSLKGKLENLKLPIIDVNLITLELKQALKFKKPTINTPFGEWKRGKTVTYAIQYKNGSHFSNIGEWASPIVIKDKANPFIIIPKNNNEFTRLVFRKFNNDNAQLVGVIKDKTVTEFRDINRDLYNALSGFYAKENIANISQTLFESHANTTAAFDQGRQPIHAAATFKILPVTVRDAILAMADINAVDDNGYTPIHIASEVGNWKMVEALCGKGADINARTYVHKLTPLHLAVRQNDTATINNLVICNNLKINLGDDNNMRPLHTAVSRNSIPIVKALLESNTTDINTKATSENLTPLHMAAIGNFHKIANVLRSHSIKRKIKLNYDARTTTMLTPLHFAVINESSEMIDFLIRNRVNVNARSATNWTPLHYAVSLRKEDIAFKLLKQDGIDVNAKNSDGFTSLHIAAGTGQEDVVDKLLNNEQIRVDETTNDGLTPLHIASMHTNINVVKILIMDKRSDIEAKTKKGLTPLLAATKKGNWEIVKYLKQNHAKLCTDGNDILTISAANGQLDIFEHFIDDNYPVGNLLKVALENGHLNIVENIINNKKVGTICAMDYKCLLNEASKYKYLNVVDYLLSKDNSISLEIPAKIAAKHGHVKILEKYINIQTADLKPYFDELMNIGVAYGWYGIVKYLHEQQKVSIKNLGALPYSSGNPKLLQYLIDNNYETSQLDDKKNTLLHYALSPIDDSICVNDIEKTGSIVQSLINQKFNVSAANLDGLTPMHMAAWSGCLQSVKLLILNKADLNPKDNKDLTPLQHLHNNNKHPKIQELLKTQEICNAIVKRKYVFTPGDNINGECISPKQHSVFETRPLLVAIASDINVADVLIQQADLSVTDAMGNTPLHFAAKYNRTKLITKLIENKVDIEAKNNQGKKAIDYAEKKKYSQIVDLLTKAHNANNQKNNKRNKRFSNEAEYQGIKANLKSADDVFKYIIAAGGSYLNQPKYNLNPLCLNDLNDKHDAIKIKNDNCLDNNLSLGYILLGNYLNKKYPLPKFSDITPEDARAGALKITQKFEKLLKKLVKNADNLDFYQLYVDIEKTIRNEKFSNIPIILTQFVRNACAADGDFENELNQEIGKVFTKLY